MVHLKAADGFEGVRIMLNARLQLVRRPAQDKDVVATRRIAQPVSANEMESGASHAPLFLDVDRLGRDVGLGVCSRANFGKDQAPPVESNKVQFAAATKVIPAENAVAFS